MRSVNAELRDRAIRHAVLLERLKAHEAAEVTAFLARDVMPDVLGRLSNALRRGLMSEDALTFYLEQIQIEELAEIFAASGFRVKELLVAVMMSEGFRTSRGQRVAVSMEEN